jgi:hypothetical protein
MKRTIDSRQVPPHGMFYMESAGGCHWDDEEPQEEHQPGDVPSIVEVGGTSVACW